MKQNRYDDPDFFARYAAMPRSLDGLAAAGEWHAFRAMLPPLAGKRVLDLGCGFGWHCRFAREAGAVSALGVDLSERMLERARAMTEDAAIAWRRAAIEDLELPRESFDIVISSLALHYVARSDHVCRNVGRWLAPGGAFVFSVEHPVFTARAEQDWHRAPDGTALHWPVDDYMHEGARRSAWLGGDVVKYHRTLATILNGVVAAGLRITGVAEPGPPEAMLVGRPELADELRRPMFLIVAAAKD